ncbi:MAG TPA: MFS transporter [Streptosporangiaceae bacterium]|nr:MFS transporter [Streptosporangiaceae bacterium]
MLTAFLRGKGRARALPAATAAQDTGRRYPAALTVLMIVLFLTFLDNTVVSVALGSVQADLHAGVTYLQWVVSAYALTFAAAMLAFGMVGDEFGRKRVMLTGVAVFCAGSVLCALAPSVQVLIAGRAVMGVGAAASEPGTLSMLRHLYPAERIRDRAIGVWTAVCGLALALGPVIGGALVGVWDWRAIFWFNLAFGTAAFTAGALILPENADPDAHRVDIPGFAFGAAALSALIFAVISAETAGFGAPDVIALLCVSVVAGLAFLWRESHTAHPLLDLRYLRVPRFLTANVVAFCAYFATFAVFFFTALYLAEVAGYSGYQIALTFLPMTAVMTIVSLLAGRWTGTAAPRWSISGGCLVFGAGLLLTALAISPSPGYLQLAGALALTGAGVGSTVVPITSAAMSAVPPQRSGMAAAAANTSREIGAVIGVAVLGMLVNAQLNTHLIASLRRLGIPPNFQAIVITAVETGTLPPSRHAGHAGPANEAKLVHEVINAAYSAFYAGLHAALFLSAGLVFAAGLFTVLWFGGHQGRRTRAGPRAADPEPGPG